MCIVIPIKILHRIWRTATALIFLSEFLSSTLSSRKCTEAQNKGHVCTFFAARGWLGTAITSLLQSKAISGDFGKQNYVFVFMNNYRIRKGGKSPLKGTLAVPGLPLVCWLKCALLSNQLFMEQKTSPWDGWDEIKITGGLLLGQAMQLSQAPAHRLLSHLCAPSQQFPCGHCFDLENKDLCFSPWDFLLSFLF